MPAAIFNHHNEFHIRETEKRIPYLTPFHTDTDTMIQNIGIIRFIRKRGFYDTTLRWSVV